MNLSSLFGSEVLVWRPVPLGALRQMEEEHGRLVEYLCAVREAMIEGEGHVRLRRLLDELLTYAEMHFQSEEQLMEEHAFPGTEEHVREHRRISGALKELIAGHARGSLVLAAEIVPIVQRWIEEHVGECDTKLVTFLERR